ncbi:hypothetical protein B0H34DRAFT_803012 [Crassisporium funariophilum]|nr:hypothetical protein B0H34DRAFT_803012 [Crassisporium funariophilum]
MANHHRYQGWPFFKLDLQLLPGWDWKTADCVQSYFDQYRKKKGQDQRVQFAAARKGSTKVPGCKLCRKIVTNLWKGRQVHSIMTAILTEEGLHPVQRTLASQAGGIDKLPNLTDYLGNAVDPVGKLFLALNAWTRRGLNQVICSQTHILQLEQDVTNAFDNLDKEEPIKANVKSVILKVAKWKALAHGLGLPDHIKKVQRIKDELQHIMITLGALLTEPSSKAKSIAFKFNDQMLKTLISEG